MADQPEAKLDNIIKLAIMAVGGQGGGVLTNWIVDLAEANCFAVQATSVAGVAQRLDSSSKGCQFFLTSFLGFPIS